VGYTDTAKIYKLACLEDSVSIGETLTEVRDMVSLINNAHVPNDYPVWRGIQGPKCMRDDALEEFDATALINLAPHAADGFVLALKTVQEE
jgi:Asp-tRNA(Asn)/Glu-tRNA(Gln) amidotransferase C subunit